MRVFCFAVLFCFSHFPSIFIYCNVLARFFGIVHTRTDTFCNFTSSCVCVCVRGMANQCPVRFVIFLCPFYPTFLGKMFHSGSFSTSEQLTRNPLETQLVLPCEGPDLTSHSLYCFLSQVSDQRLFMNNISPHTFLVEEDFLSMCHFHWLNKETALALIGQKLR